jgi:hypothetical protein
MGRASSRNKKAIKLKKIIYKLVLYIVYLPFPGGTPLAATLAAPAAMVGGFPPRSTLFPRLRLCFLEAKWMRNMKELLLWKERMISGKNKRSMNTSSTN